MDKASSIFPLRSLPAAAMQSFRPKIEDIVAGGDIILRLRGERRIFRFCVSSTAIGTASTVFADNVRDRLSPTEEAVLRGDDDMSLRTLLYALHMRNDLVPKFLYPEELFHVASLANKYKCAQALKFCFETWFLKHSDFVRKEDLAFLIAVA